MIKLVVKYGDMFFVKFRAFLNQDLIWKNLCSAAFDDIILHMCASNNKTFQTKVQDEFQTSTTW